MYLIGVMAIILGTVITAYKWVVIIQALLTFVNPDPYNQFVQILKRIVEPAYELVKKLPFPTSFNGIDLSPLVIILSLEVVTLAIINPLSKFYVI